MAEQYRLPDVPDLPDADTPAPAEQSPPAVAPPGLNINSSLRTALGAFEVHMQQRGFAENTVKAFLSDLNILSQFIGMGTAIGDISTRDINHFTHWLVQGRGVDCSPKSLARRVTTLKVFFGWLAEVEVLPSDPAAAVIHKPVMTPLPQILSDAEVERVLGVTQALRNAEKPDARPHLLVTLLLYTGIKKGECMNIVMNHFDFGDPTQPILWIRYANPRRRHKERKLRLPVWWPAVLAEYRVQYQPQESLFPCTARNLEYVLANVAQRGELAHGLSFEMLRWTCAVRDYRAKMDADKLRQKLGISKITWREVGAKIIRLSSPAL
ncbi:MAG: phage integrase N-terminal SAM-like domain-containing protein [Chloroflexota bacterium]|nr:phage integrase N-terminal SAM-like domain-containing protein [Chloroflexota bacterium]